MTGSSVSAVTAYTAHREWASRPPDERYASVHALYDAARVDGASDLGVFRHIALPLSKAVIAVVALFTGVGIWNTFFNAILYLNDSSKWPIQVVLRQYVLEASTIVDAGSFPPNQPPPPTEALQMAMVVLATVPILIVYPFLQKYFTKGVLTGAIKG